MNSHPDESLTKSLYYYWPDGTYMEASEFSEVGDAWRGNDFGRLAVDAAASEEEIVAAVTKANQFWSTLL